MLYSGFSILPRSVIRSANSIDRSDNLDVMPLTSALTAGWDKLMTQRKQLSELDADSIRITSERRMVRIDDATEEVEQCYLEFRGTPEGFRWLSQHFSSLAKSAENQGSSGNIVAAWDFKNSPIALGEWDSLDFHCK